MVPFKVKDMYTFSEHRVPYCLDVWYGFTTILFCVREGLCLHLWKYALNAFYRSFDRALVQIQGTTMI
jgi:hypothetical protein